MLGQFSTITSHVKWKPSVVSIDNGWFALHYRVTLMLLLCWTVIECGTQYIGEHIRCISEKTFAGLENVINSYCFFMATFTAEQRNNSAFLKAHPGIGPIDLNSNDQPIRIHYYYQWVPFVLFLQGLSFCITRRLWKRMENGTLQALSNGLNRLSFSPSTSEKISNIKLAVFDENDAESLAKVEKVTLAVLDRLELNAFWAYSLIFCEVLNVLNVIVQIFLTDWFLQGGFFELGSITTGTQAQAAATLDTIFPKISKCVFRKFGPSGSLQTYDIMCILALNIVNEKAFLCLWYWYWILLSTSIFALLWRLGTFISFKVGKNFNATLFRWNGVYLDPITAKCLGKELTFSNWLFIYYLVANLMPKASNKFINQLVEEIKNKNKSEDVLLIKNIYD